MSSRSQSASALLLAFSNGTFLFAQIVRVATACTCSGACGRYVVTRWYRAPEIMLACPNYTKAIDVWAVGCIMGELFGRKPLFPGNDYIHQLKIISDIVGTPAEEDLDFITSERARNFMLELPRKTRIPFNEIYPDIPAEGLDLLEKMLQFHPRRRITAEPVS